MPDEVDILLAHIALDEKFVTQEQFAYCLRSMVTLEKGGQPAALTGIMIEHEFLTESQLVRIRSIADERGQQHLVDGFQVTGVLGQGAMGCVYLATQISMDRPVALKILASEHTQDENWVKRFVREARATAKLNHVNIVQGIDVGESNSLYYFAMELVPGHSLGELLRVKDQFGEREAAQIILQAAKALEHAWEFGIVHRDIKPDNLLMTDQGVVKLADMGLAKLTDVGVVSQQKEGSSVTNAGSVLGTPTYISPEQARGQRDVDTRSDIYSLGITFWRLLAGRLPFIDPNPAVVLSKHMNERLPPLARSRPGITSVVEEIVHRMTAKKPEWRYQTPSELIRDLDGYLAGKLDGSSQGVFTSSETMVLDGGAGSFKFCHVPSEAEVYFLLIAMKNEIMNKDQVSKALDYQEARAAIGAVQELGDVCVEKGYMTKRHRAKIREAQQQHQDQARMAHFGEIGIKLGFVCREELDECRAMQEDWVADARKQPLGDLMVSRQYLSEEQKHEILAEQTLIRRSQQTKRFGTIGLVCRFIGKTELKEALDLQAKVIRSELEQAPRLGEILVQMGHMTTDQVQVVLRAKRRSQLLGRPPRELVEEMREKSEPEHGESNTSTVSGLFENVSLKGLDAVDCPFCGGPIEAKMSDCPRCHKALD